MTPFSPLGGKFPESRARVSPEAKSLGDKQRQLQQALAHKEKRRILQKLTQIGGVQRYKDELRQALAEVLSQRCLFEAKCENRVLQNQ